jgi:hypothetical protein
MKRTILKKKKNNAADPDQFDVDPDLTFHFHATRDPGQDSNVRS